MGTSVNKSSTKQENNVFELDTLLAISRDCLISNPPTNASGAAPLRITQLKHVKGFNQREKQTLETEMSTLLGALLKAQQSYLSLALSHMDAEQRIWEDFEKAWSDHLVQMTDVVQGMLQRDPLNRARG